MVDTTTVWWFLREEEIEGGRRKHWGDKWGWKEICLGVLNTQYNVH